MALPILSRGWKVTIFLKKLNFWSPRPSWGKYVTEVGRGQEMMDTKRMPRRIAPRTRYIINRTVNILTTDKFSNKRLAGQSNSPSDKYSKPHSGATKDPSFAVTHQIGVHVVCWTQVTFLYPRIRSRWRGSLSGVHPPSPTRLVVLPPITPKPEPAIWHWGVGILFNSRRSRKLT